MGRKFQKTNRHKKLKAVDPFYTGDRKLLIDKKLILANQAPDLKEDNKLPSKLREILRYNDEMKAKKKSLSQNKNKKNLLKKASAEVLLKKPDEQGAQVPLRPVAELKQQNNESEAKFLNRIDREVEHVIHRSQYEDQFDVKLETKDDKVVVIKEKKMREAKRRSLNKLKDKLKLKKTNAAIERNNKVKNDVVRFGEIVHQPPIITAFPKYSTRKLLNPNNSLTIPLNTVTKNGITEKDRNEVIQRYRLMKTEGKFKFD